jgi:hypothetical protein
MAALAADPPPDGTPEAATPVPDAAVIEAVNQAVSAAIDEKMSYTMFFWGRTIRIEDTTPSGDGQWAASSLVPYNPKNDQIPEGEPALIISQKVDGEWQVWMPNDPDWLEMVMSTPDDLLSPELKQA